MLVEYRGLFRVLLGLSNNIWRPRCLGLSDRTHLVHGPNIGPTLLHNIHLSESELTETTIPPIFSFGDYLSRK